MEKPMRLAAGAGFTVVLVTCLCDCAPARAESLFQRLPEPGSWCSYHTTMLPIVEDSPVSRPEQNGQLAISALDIVDHNGVPHQWIEITNAIEVPTADADEPDVVETMTYKCLVRRDQLQAGGDPLASIARGWLKIRDSQPRESDVESFTGEGQEALVLMFVMTRPLVDRMPVTVPNSVRVDGEDFETSEGFTGSLEPIQFADDLTIDGEFSYWTHDSAGFGVLASEFLLNTRRSLGPNTTLKMQIAVQLDLEAQGDGAVSKLPDHG
jgi:hypothetical protein